jgi:Protein of unknown function (DUF3775)
MKLSAIVERVIALARAVDELKQERWQAYPKFHAISMSELANLPEVAAAERKELHDFITGLPPATIYMLVMLMNLGRGVFDTEDLLGSYIEVSDRCPTPDGAVEYLLCKPVDQYLTEALRRLSNAKIDVDRVLE